MDLRKYLLKNKDILHNPQQCSFFKSFWQPSVKGEFGDYNAEFGVKIGRTPGGYHYDDYCKIKLNTPPQLPVYLKFCLHLGGNFYLKNSWLILYHYGAYASKKEMISYFKNQIEETIKNKFAKLTEKAQEIELCTINLEKYKKKQKKENLRWIVIDSVIIISVILICLIYLSA